MDISSVIENFTTYESTLGEKILIKHLVGYHAIKQLLESKKIDCIVVECEDGFSQLGGMRSLISKDLGFNERNLIKYALDGFPIDLKKNISSIADWCRSNKEVTLAAMESNLKNSQLKGILICPYDDAQCYKKFSALEYPIPYRDFMYNVTYEAISHAYKKWNVKNIGITHFSRSKMSRDFNSDTTICQLESAIHFSNEHKGIESFIFLDEVPGNQPIKMLAYLQNRKSIGRHRLIKTNVLEHIGVDFINLEIPPPQNKST